MGVHYTCDCGYYGPNRHHKCQPFFDDWAVRFFAWFIPLVVFLLLIVLPCVALAVVMIKGM
jgi:hypothetical protein